MSTDTKWTKGKWKLGLNDYIKSEAGPYVALICCDSDEADANAHLIAAAPALYEALEKLLARFEELRDDFESETGARYEQDSDLIDNASIVLAIAGASACERAAGYARGEG